MTITTIFFDLDDTLYPAKSGLWREIKERISVYMHERLGIPIDQAATLRQKYLQEYGTTLLGLQANYTLDVQDFLDFVHGLPLRDYIQPTLGLRSVLATIPARKFIFSNADASHIQRVLNVLELDGCFDGVLDILSMFPYCKPMPESFALALKLAGETDPLRCVLIDDLPRNTRVAREQGFHTILYGADEPHPDADAVLSDLLLLPNLLGRVFPELF
jgi:putative hydrolase of the HAD superfamily